MNKSLSRRQLATFIAGRLVAAPSSHKQLMRELAAFLVEHNRTNESELLLNDIAHELTLQSGQLSLEVATAQKISADSVKDITKFITRATGATAVSVHQTVQPELLGGFIARTPDAELNASVQHNLQKLAAIT